MPSLSLTMSDRGLLRRVSRITTARLSLSDGFWGRPETAMSGSSGGGRGQKSLSLSWPPAGFRARISIHHQGRHRGCGCNSGGTYPLCRWSPDLHTGQSGHANTRADYSGRLIKTTGSYRIHLP